jgi:hypothetical protein
VLETYNDQQWLYNFVNLCRELEPHLKPNESFVRAHVDVKKQVAIAIYLLGSSAEYRTIENLFGVSTSTVCKVVHMVCDAMGFPNCGGAIGGCHIPIIAPENSYGDYLNRKGWYSLILQGVCDYKYVFTDINI